MNQRAIIHIIGAVMGIPILLTIGIWSATDPVYAGVSALIVISIWVLTQLGTRVWLLIPFFAGFTGAVNVLPGNFAPRDIAVGVVVVLLLPLWVVRRFPIRVMLGKIELALLVLLLFVLQSYLRNPVGLSIFGSGTIGGRPYFEIAVSVVSFCILSILVVDFRSVRTMVLANFVGHMVSASIAAVLSLIPGVAPYAAMIYNTGATDVTGGSQNGATAYEGTGRVKFLAAFSGPIMNLILSFKSPLQLIYPRNFLYLLLAAMSGVFILVSGFRSRVVGYVFMVIASAFLHRKSMQIFVIGMIASPFFAILLMLQGSVIQLPLSAQRALSFLPGDWDRRAATEAKNSTEWRLLMWEEALTSERYIRNKWLGDGFGFTARELAYQQELMYGGETTTDQQEYHLTTGTYHSGPIETVKRIGYIGFVVLLVVMGVFVKVAVAFVRRTKSTPYQPYAIYLAMPLVIMPFGFVLVVGSFQYAVSSLLLLGGMLRLMQNSFEVWDLKERTARAEPDRVGVPGAGRAS